jgi:bifunctional non-homologous end joining protein LigD
MAPYILPYLLNRPHSLNRHPNGIDSPNFFQKDMKGTLPDWMHTHQDFSESTNTNVKYLVCNGEASLIYMANLGCIEINPWHSRTDTWQKPDWCLLDLDPEGVGFDKVIEVAQVIKKILDAIGAKGYCKTSGATGMHIYLPLGAQYHFEQSKHLAELICRLVMRELPSLTSMERSPAKRKKKVYLDFLQNKETQTAAAPYSLRPKRDATVSTPLHWDEVKKGLTPAAFTIKNIYERVKAEGDLFQPVLGKGINLEKLIEKLAAIID